MRYKFSRCFAMEHPQSNELIKFYRDQVGLNLVRDDAGQVEFDTAPVRLFAQRGEKQAIMFELVVENLDDAREDLIGKGCEIVRWEGKGKTCYVKDPFGFIFNVWEDPQAFE